MTSRLREAIADVGHEQWSGWMRWLFQFGTQNENGTFTMTADKVARWRRQMETPFNRLSPTEQDTDRNEADKFLRVFADHATAERVPPFTGYLAQYGAFPVLFDATGAPRFAHWGTPRSRPPSEIVLHYTAGGTFDANVIYLTKPNARHVSAHFVIGREGQVALICPLNVIAWHAGKWSRNRTSIGIENVHANDDTPYPEAQLEALVQLCAQLCELFGIDPAAGIVGHRDIVPTVCPRALDVAAVQMEVAREMT